MIIVDVDGDERELARKIKNKFPNADVGIYFDVCSVEYSVMEDIEVDDE